MKLSSLKPGLPLMSPSSIAQLLCNFAVLTLDCVYCEAVFYGCVLRQRPKITWSTRKSVVCLSYYR